VTQILPPSDPDFAAQCTLLKNYSIDIHLFQAINPDFSIANF